MISSFQEFATRKIPSSSPHRFRTPRQKNQLFFLKDYLNYNLFNDNKLQRLFSPQPIKQSPKLHLTNLLNFRKNAKKHGIHTSVKSTLRQQSLQKFKQVQHPSFETIKLMNKKFRHQGVYEKNKIMKAFENNRHQIYKQFMNEQYSHTNFNLCKQFIDLMRHQLSISSNQSAVYEKSKLKRYGFNILMQVTTKGLSEVLTINELKFLKKYMQVICEKIFNNTTLQEIGGISRMKELFELLYNRFQSDQFLSHLLIEHDAKKDQLQKYFYYFMKDQLTLLRQQILKAQLKISCHQCYIIKQRFWQLLRDKIPTKIITRLLENLELLFKDIYFNAAFPLTSNKSKLLVSQSIHVQQIFLLKSKWENGSLNPYNLMIVQQGIKLSEIMLQAQKYLKDSDFLKHYPEQMDNLIYTSEEYSGLQILQYIIICVFSDEHCIQSNEIYQIVCNQKISEYVPGLWINGLKYSQQQLSKKGRKNLVWFENWTIELMNIFQKLGLIKQFKKQ